MQELNYKLAVAPMLHRTDRWFRYCVRMLTKHTVLYTEMLTVNTLLHTDPQPFLFFDPIELPLVLQLGGNDPKTLAHCAKLAESWGYSAVNLNVGCPSDRAQAGGFGACLMLQPELVAECVATMQATVTIPITVKHRIGIDHQDSYAALAHFIELVSQAGCKTFIIHARKAWLSGLSPRENRQVPALDYAMVYAIKQNFPALKIIINGGIKDLQAASSHLSSVDGVMIGRAAYDNPWLLAQADSYIFDKPAFDLTRQELIQRLIPWIQQEVSKGIPITRITKHLLGLFYGQPGGRLWRRCLSENAYMSGGDPAILQDCYAACSLK